jgi:hypothetical protein
MKFLAVEARNAGRSGLAYYHAHWTRDGAPLLDELGAVIDHVEAFSTGGLDSEENLITACNKCNGRKSAAPLDKWSKRHMRKPIKGKYGEPQHWDGLTSVFVTLAERNLAALAAGEKDWLKAIKSNEHRIDMQRDSYAKRGALIAPTGKFRVIGVDTFEGPDADFLIGDFITVAEAIRAAKPRAGDMKPVYVYDDRGKLLFSAGKP